MKLSHTELQELVLGAARAEREAGEIIGACAARHRDMRVIDGTDLVTHDESLFGDGRLHPNDEGFAEYFENLVKKASL